MKKGDEASPSIILASRALSVKMLITLEPRYAFGSNFEYFSFFLISFFFIFFSFFFLFFCLFFVFFVFFFEYLFSFTLPSYWCAKT